MKTNYFGQDRYRHTRIWLRLIWLQSERDSKEALKPNGLSCKSNNKDSSYCIVSRKRSKPLYMEQTKYNWLYLEHGVTSYENQRQQAVGCIGCHFSMSLANLLLSTIFFVKSILFHSFLSIMFHFQARGQQRATFLLRCKESS